MLRAKKKKKKKLIKETLKNKFWIYMMKKKKLFGFNTACVWVTVERFSKIQEEEDTITVH